jgi:hypothetical protein
VSRKHLPVGLVDRTGLRRWFEVEFGYKPGYYTISEAIRQGMPCEPHPRMDGNPGARQNPPTFALEKPTMHQPWMTLLYPPRGGGARGPFFSGEFSRGYGLEGRQHR